MIIEHASREKSGSNAFTLMEVILSVGIVAVILIPMMAALSRGIEKSGRSTDRINESRIIRHLAGVAQQSEWSDTHDLEDLDGTLWYFDDRANALDSVADGERRVYVARLRVGPAFTVPGTGSPNEDAKYVRFLVSNRPALPDPFGGRAKLTTSGILITRQGSLADTSPP